ncbi:hypothetical protein JL101_025805 [Skermanella rosea]|uniref:hypothetical protein n=1 Tax=Skermanella rosea TaxID=1817965 RepID=UPI0019312924|nr:hypothetical protein [Skermanella rosea]UEM03344.1 hypothetical protein JL101_025805 [Skermanella rosea]
MTSLPLRRCASGGASDDARDEGAHALRDELPDFECQHLGRIHLDVQEFHDALEFRMDLVGDEDHADTAGTEIGVGLPPEGLRVGIGPEKAGEDAGGLFLRLLGSAGPLELELQLVHRPIDDSIGGIVQHLGDHFPPAPGVGGALYLDQRRHGVLVDEQVVERPTSFTAVFARHRLLARDEKPAPRVVGVDLIAGDEAGVCSQQALEQIFGSVGSRPHFSEAAVVPDEIDAVAHGVLYSFVVAAQPTEVTGRAT